MVVHTNAIYVMGWGQPSDSSESSKYSCDSIDSIEKSLDSCNSRE